MMFRVLPVILMMMGITGCNNAINYKEYYSKATVCCKSYAGLKYHSVKFDEDEKEALMMFPEGKSFFLAIALPSYTAPYEVQISSKVMFNQLFLPTVLILDKNFSPIGKINHASLKYSGGSVKIKFFVNEQNRKFSYLNRIFCLRIFFKLKKCL